MKRILCLAAGFLAVAPVLAEHAVGMPTPIDGPTPTIGELLQTSQAMRAQRASEVNIPPPPEVNWQLLIEVAINAPGRFGTMYMSDYFGANLRPTSQEILVGFIAAGVNNAGAPTTRFSLAPNTVYSIPDYLGPSYLNKTGVGSILITGVLPGTSTPDTSAWLVGSMRIWTRENATSTATTSFTLNAANPNRIVGDVNVIVYGVRQNNDFRTNYTLVNLDPVNTRSWNVTAIAGNTSSWTVSLPPVSMQQFATPSSVTPTSSGYFVYQFTPTFTGSSPQWSGSADTGDNGSGDAYHNYGLNLAFAF